MNSNFIVRILRPFLLLILAFGTSQSTFAAEDEEVGYDTLVQQLTKSSAALDTSDPLSEVQIHLGAAFANSMFVVEPKSNTTLYSTQSAVQATLGIDLFSTHWVAEGAFANFIEKQYDIYQIHLKEFDLKVIYKNRLDGALGYRLGAGLATRYLTLTTDSSEETYTTPFSILSGGLETYLTHTFSLGIEVATRNTLTSETPDRSALDVAFRFDGHF
jgi:hypothetical protein